MAVSEANLSPYMFLCTFHLSEKRDQMHFIILRKYLIAQPTTVSVKPLISTLLGHKLLVVNSCMDK